MQIIDISPKAKSRNSKVTNDTILFQMSGPVLLDSKSDITSKDDSFIYDVLKVENIATVNSFTIIDRENIQNSR
ncbi:hypothetical protein GF312_16505 [Candidatus Poribacteria bacterium]|nr:hypothetical protein [Candidatus Poribacteria bacterium]